MAVITVSLIYAVLLCNIYSVCGNTEHISYIGCFYDAYDPQTGTTVDAQRVLPHAMQKLRGGMGMVGMTIGNCMKFCTEQTFSMQYAGLETGEECYCGTAEAPYNTYGQRDDSECMVTRCSGNVNQYCGNDFRIAVYNLTLVRCQLPTIPGLDASNPHFIPVYDIANFTCLPDPRYQLSGPDSVQCIFDDDINDTRWASDLPQCLSIPTTASITTAGEYSTTNSNLLSTMTTGTTMSDETNLPVIIGVVAGVCVIVVTICVVICILVLMTKRKRKATEATQSHGTPMSPTSNGSTTKTQKDPSDFPVYSQPIRPKSRGKSLHQEQLNDNATSPTKEQTKPKIDETYSYADVQKETKLKIDETYSYADVKQETKPTTDGIYSYADLRINSPNVAKTNVGVSDETDWEDNNIYGKTEEPEGWRDNNIYEASND